MLPLSRAPRRIPAASLCRSFSSSALDSIGVFLAPSVRRLLLENPQVDPRVVVGYASGPQNRLLKGDVLRAIADAESGNLAVAPASSPTSGIQQPGFSGMASLGAVTAQAADSLPQGFARDGRHRVHVDMALTPEQQQAAGLMLLSKKSLPHAYSSTRAEVDNVLDTLKLFGEATGNSIDLKEYIVSAAAQIAAEVPGALAQYTGDGVVIPDLSGGVNVCLAMDFGEGMRSAVLAGASRMGAGALRDAIQEWKKGGTAPGQMAPTHLGVTVSATDKSYAVLGSAQGATLTIGDVQRVVRPGLGEDGGQRVCTTIELAMTTDGRSVGEDVAERFLTKLKDRLEMQA